ncbi:VENN motif pre-toxin domain-containing protein [Snodgrassella sp. B3882]|uniref:VENN motif pre-toxin domain-containing protein n=1 Tax=Snodgrassella sp. B3882 TaxID=2818037 RepID=UPI003A7F5151|nr:VENN motif pre-toxin domain-containing protein [Snodgrassella sp. B3882]
MTGGNISNAQIAGVAGMNAVENNYLSEDRLMYYSKKLRNCTNKKECDQIIQQMNEEDERNRKLLTDICSKDRFSKACRDQIGNAQSGDDMVYTPIDNNNLDGVRGKFLVTDLCGINQTCINTFLEQDRKNKADTEFGKEKTIKQQASQIKQYPIYKHVDFSEMTDEEIYNFHNQMLLGIVLSGGSKLAGKTSGRKNSPNSQGEKGSNKINVAEALKKSFRIFNDNISAGKGSKAGKGTGLTSTQIKDVKAISAAEANKPHIDSGWNSPYDPSAQVRQFTTVTEIKGEFVRVYVEGLNKPSGAFIVRASEIKGMTPQQIQQHLALPAVPTHIVDVTIPAGTKMQTGKVAAQPNFGVQNKVGTQYQLLQEIPINNFHNKRPIK